MSGVEPSEAGVVTGDADAIGPSVLRGLVGTGWLPPPNEVDGNAESDGLDEPVAGLAAPNGADGGVLAAGVDVRIVAVAFGVAVRVGFGLDVVAARTTIVPCICSGWIWQKYGYVPGFANG